AMALFAAIAAVHPTHAAPAAVIEPAYSFTFSDAKEKPHKNSIKVETPAVVAPVTQVTVTPPTAYSFHVSEATQEKLQEKIDSRMRERTESNLKDGANYQIAGTDEEESDAESWYDRANTYYQHGSFEKAGRAYESAARFGYESGKAYYNAGCSYALAGQTDDAIKMLRHAFAEGFEDPEKYDTDSDLNSLRGDARFQKLLDEVRHSDTGIENLRAAENQYQHLASAGDVENGDWNSAGIDLMRAGAYDRAATAFDNEYKASGDNDALYNKACARALGGKTSDALDLLEQTIAAGSVDIDHMRTDPDLAPLRNDKRFEGLCELERALDLSDSWKHDDKSWKGNEQMRWQSVLTHYEDVAKDYPKLGRAWFNLGFVQLMVDQPQKSSVSFQKALDLGFRNPTTLYNLACANARAGNQDAAFNYLAQAEKAGFDVANHAMSDDDLDPIKADARWRELKQRWQSEEDQKHREKNKKKYD
ncbi:MAG TPA: tetratricopeptide repeat protein, partial [Candidatus Krumholzibacteria bacterium]|nr:tetratricopeptide repeat protein [Candidatus Krumholzibacteria bacterium]